MLGQHRRNGLLFHFANPKPSDQWHQGQHDEGRTKTAFVCRHGPRMINQHARKKGTHEIGDGGTDGQPAKGFLELIRIAGHAAHMALQCNDRNAGGAARG